MKRIVTRLLHLPLCCPEAPPQRRPEKKSPSLHPGRSASAPRACAEPCVTSGPGSAIPEGAEPRWRRFLSCPPDSTASSLLERLYRRQSHGRGKVTLGCSGAVCFWIVFLWQRAWAIEGLGVWEESSGCEGEAVWPRPGGLERFSRGREEAGVVK